MIDDHKCGLAANEASSRKIRTARRFHQGLANRCNPACSRGANRSSAAWEYEMNPSYTTDDPPDPPRGVPLLSTLVPLSLCPELTAVMVPQGAYSLVTWIFIIPLPERAVVDNQRTNRTSATLHLIKCRTGVDPIDCALLFGKPAAESVEG